MTKEELFRAVGEVREDQITDAESVKKQSRPWRRYGALAACLAVVLAAAFALERIEGARRWAALEESFHPLTMPESVPDDGGGAGTGGLDGTEYWSGGEKRPASSCSVNVEIAELQEQDVEYAALKRAGGVSSADRAEVSSSSCLAWLSPEEIFAQDTAIFRGTVRELRYYAVEEARLGGGRTQYTAAAVGVTDAIRGDVAAGETRTILYAGGPDMSTSLSGPLDALEVGSDAIFMPIAATPETGWREGDSWFCYADLGEFYLSEGLRYVFLDTGEGLDFSRSAYEEIAGAETLDEVADYIRRMTGAGQSRLEKSRPEGVPAEPQPAPADTAEADPALLDPGYGAPGPAGARELPGGAFVGDEDGK